MDGSSCDMPVLGMSIAGISASKSSVSASSKCWQDPHKDRSVPGLIRPSATRFLVTSSKSSNSNRLEAISFRRRQRVAQRHRIENIGRSRTALTIMILSTRSALRHAPVRWERVDALGAFGCHMSACAAIRQQRTRRSRKGKLPCTPISGSPSGLWLCLPRAGLRTKRQRRIAWLDRTKRQSSPGHHGQRCSKRPRTYLQAAPKFPCSKQGDLTTKRPRTS